MEPSQPRVVIALSILALGGVISACSPAQTIREIRLQFDPPPRVIFGPEDAERWIAEMRDWVCQEAPDCSALEDYIVGNVGLPYRSESYWRPSQSEVRRFERKLAFALEQARYDYPRDPPAGLWQYSVQYIGYVRDGRRLIFANGGCGYHSDVREQWMMVYDGGTCYFGASFDPRTGEFLGIGFNGYA